MRTLAVLLLVLTTSVLSHKIIPEYEINLDLAPDQRYIEVTKDLGPVAVDGFNQIMEKLG